MERWSRARRVACAHWGEGEKGDIVLLRVVVGQAGSRSLGVKSELLFPSCWRRSIFVHDKRNILLWGSNSLTTQGGYWYCSWCILLVLIVSSSQIKQGCVHMLTSEDVCSVPLSNVEILFDLYRNLIVSWKKIFVSKEAWLICFQKSLGCHESADSLLLYSYGHASACRNNYPWELVSEQLAQRYFRISIFTDTHEIQMK